MSPGGQNHISASLHWEAWHSGLSLTLNKGKTLRGFPGGPPLGSPSSLKTEPHVYSSSSYRIITTGAPRGRRSPCTQATVTHELVVSQSLLSKAPPLPHLILQAFFEESQGLSCTLWDIYQHQHPGVCTPDATSTSPLPVVTLPNVPGSRMATC